MNGTNASASATGVRGASDLIVRMEDVNKWYSSFHALKDINLSVTRGERIVICGPSGSGKSTMIRCINQLETIQKGKIVVDGHDLTPAARMSNQSGRRRGWSSSSLTCFPI